jgi:chromate transport protein ChrA
MHGLRAPIVCLRISSAVLFFIASMQAAAMITVVWYTGVSPNYYVMSVVITMIAMGVALGLWAELVIRNLRKQKRWAWIAGIVTFSFYLPTLFVIPAIVGLTRMLRKDIREVFSEEKNGGGHKKTV